MSGLIINENKNLYLGDQLEKQIEADAKAKHNAMIDNQKQDLEHMVESINSNSKSLEGLEFVPNGSRIIIKQYAKNPYMRVETSDSGLIISGLSTFIDPYHKSQESGEMEKDEQGIVVGQVIEVGPECKYAKIGDDVFYLGISAAVTPFPFFDQGFSIIPEQNILVFINEQLKARILKNE